MNYATLYQLRQYLGLAATETSDDARLQQFLGWASGFMDDIRRCDVRRETRTLDYPIKRASNFGVFSADEWVAQMNSAADLSLGILRLDDDLVAVETLTNGDLSVIAPAHYVLQPANLYPKSRIKLRGSAGVAWQTSPDGDREQCISVLGLWGYHPDYGRAWVDSLDTVRDNPLTAITTSLTVADVDGQAGDEDMMRFQAGQMLKIESEFVLVLATNATTNILTIKRAYNGTAAAQHAQGTAIYIYRPYEKVKDGALRMATWRYRQKDANSFDRTTILGTGIAITPSALPPDIRDLLPPARPLELVDTEAL